MIRLEKGEESMGVLRDAERALWTLSQKLRGRQRTREIQREREKERERAKEGSNDDRRRGHPT